MIVQVQLAILAGFLGYMLGRAGLRALLRWRWRRMLRQLAADNPISEAAKDVAYFDAVESGMIRKAERCRKCWQGTVEHVRNQVAAPPIFDMCRECKEGERRRYLGAKVSDGSITSRKISSGAITPHYLSTPRRQALDDYKFWKEKFEEATKILEELQVPIKYSTSDVVVDTLDPTLSTRTTRNGHLVTGYEDDFEEDVPRGF